MGDAARRDRTLPACIAQLQAVFREIQATRMRGVPLLHPALQVEAVGFRPDADGAVASGVLVTPWFMSLLRLPLHDAAAATMFEPGRSGVREWGTHAFDFLGAHEPALGRYEASSLFSPMAEFADQAAAVATARAVLDLLRDTHGPAQPARRGFLFGRPAAGGAAA